MNTKWVFGISMIFAVTTAYAENRPCLNSGNQTLSAQARVTVEAVRKLAESPEPAKADLGKCSPELMAKAPAGSICHTATSTWRVEDELYSGKRVYLDLKSRLKITEPLNGVSSQYDATDRCNNGYFLPSGYPSDLNGEYGYLDQNSDFEVLERDGFRQVVPGIRDNCSNSGVYGCRDSFWSRTIGPTLTGYAYFFHGPDGKIGNYPRDFTLATFCVSRAWY